MQMQKINQFVFTPKFTKFAKIYLWWSDNQSWSFIRAKSCEAEMLIMAAVEHSVP